MFKNVKKTSLALTLTLLLMTLGINVSAGSETLVVPMGEAVGVKLYTEGLLVVGVDDNSPVKSSGIKINDRIEYAQNTEIKTSEQFADIVNKCVNTLSLTIDRNGEKLNMSVTPEISQDGTKKLGLWVRDSTAGIGTLTYYNPENNTFAALGHGINDVDTGNILTVKSGNILPCKILSVTKSKNGAPGELNASFDGSPLGKISLNAENGIYGTLSPEGDGEAIPVAACSEVTEGGAYILANVDGSGVKKYDIEIIKIIPGNKSHKNMVVSITDKTLLSLTGGIVQGMSGAPIIQNGKLAGALTHVFVNDSDKGYGTFAENMLKISNSI